MPGSKMIQSDTLSQRPDYGLETEKQKEAVLLPDKLFLGLLDMELQQRILDSENLDVGVKNAIEALLQKGPTELKNDLENWKVEEVDRK